MRGYCAKCGRTVEGQMLCPHCGVQVGDPAEGRSQPQICVTLPYDPQDGPSVPRRFLLGAISLIGFFHGLKHLALAVLLSQSASQTLSSDGLLSLVVVATLAAATAAGTVNRWAEVTGLLLALGAAAGYLGPDLARGDRPPHEWLIGLPVLLALVGLAGGFAGRLLMPPAPRLPRFDRFRPPASVVVSPRPEPLAWILVLLGVTVAVMGTVFADHIRGGLSEALAGQSRAFGATALLTWQVSVLAAVVGGFVAGANTRAGARQGFVTGLLTAAGAVGATVALDPTKSVLIEFWLHQLDQNEVGPLVFAAFGGSVWVIVAVGGWLGAQLCPPRRR